MEAGVGRFGEADQVREDEDDRAADGHGDQRHHVAHQPAQLAPDVVAAGDRRGQQQVERLAFALLVAKFVDQQAKDATHRKRAHYPSCALRCRDVVVIPTAVWPRFRLVRA